MVPIKFASFSQKQQRQKLKQLASYQFLPEIVILLIWLMGVSEGRDRSYANFKNNGDDYNASEGARRVMPLPTQGKRIQKYIFQ